MSQLVGIFPSNEHRRLDLIWYTVESPAVSCTFVFKKCWPDTNKNMTDITTEIKKTNEDAESIQKRKSTRRKKVKSRKLNQSESL